MKRLASLALALLLAAGSSAAQAPDEEKPAKKPKPRVSLDLSAEESYESNVPYTQLLGEDDFVTRGMGRLTLTLPITRGAVELAGEGSANVYRTVKGLDRYTWGGSAALDHRFSRRSELKVQARAARGYARDNPRLDLVGTLAPLTLLRSETGEAAYRQRLGRSFDLRLDGRGERFRFDSPELQDGWSAGGRLGFENAFGTRFALGAEGQYTRTATYPQLGLLPAFAPRPGRTIEVVSGVGTMKIVMARGLELRLEGGAARFGAIGDPVPPEGALPVGSTTAGGTIVAPPLAAPAGPPLVPDQPEVTPQLAGTLTGTFGRHTVTALASRRIEQSYGIGAIGINRVFSLGYRGQLANWAALSLIGTDNENAASDATVLSNGRTFSASFDFTFPVGFGARTTYSYWDREDPFRNWRSHTVAVALSKRFDWR